MFTNHATKCFRGVFKTQGKTSLKGLSMPYLVKRFESPRFESISEKLKILEKMTKRSKSSTNGFISKFHKVKNG